MSKSQNDWERFSTINKKFSKALAKFSRSRENTTLRKSNSEGLFCLVNQKTRTLPKNKILKDEKGSILSSSWDKAEAFANFFHSAHANEVTLETDDFLLPETMARSTVPYFTKEAIHKMLTRCKRNYTVTPDAIPGIFIRNLALELCSPLEIVYNNSLWTGVVPNLWKIAYITPIPKSNLATEVKDFRPISITSHFSRTFEKLLRQNLDKFVSENKIIPNDQHGFIKQKSVETNVLESLNIWTKLLDNSKSVDVIYFDFTKAFDRVNHELLISKLRSAGFHDKTVFWLKNFVTNRSFQVKQGDVLSNMFPVPNGVPQGGCLSPLLFSLFTRELPELLSNCGVFCRVFADDVKIFGEVATEIGRENIQNAVNALVAWSEKWGLSLSHPKTKVLHLGSRNSKHSYSIGTDSISPVEHTVRDLGFHFSQDLSFKAHAKIAAKKAKYRTFNLFKSIKMRDQDTWVRIYTSYVRPIAEFGPTIINGYPAVAKIYESIQNDFTRKLFMRLGATSYRAVPSPSTRNELLGLDSLQLRRDIADLKMVNKLLSPKSLIDLSQFFTIRTSITRGQPQKLSYTRAKGRLRANFFTCRAGSKYLRYSKIKPIPKSSIALKNIIQKSNT